MNIELHILVGQPRGKAGEPAKRELKVIASCGTRSELLAARKKVKPADFVFIGEVKTNGMRLKNRRHFESATEKPAAPAGPAQDPATAPEVVPVAANGSTMTAPK